MRRSRVERFIDKIPPRCHKEHSKRLEGDTDSGAHIIPEQSDQTCVTFHVSSRGLDNVSDSELSGIFIYEAKVTKKSSQKEWRSRQFRKGGILIGQTEVLIGWSSIIQWFRGSRRKYLWSKEREHHISDNSAWKYGIVTHRIPIVSA
jgi:hypothetical protein